MDLSKYTALELGALIKKGELKVVDLVSYYIKKAENDPLNAFISVNGKSALERAAEVQKGIEKGIYASPLAGVPIAVKDNICTKDIRTTAASKMLENFYPVYNATVIERLEAAGLVVLGKLNMDEFAMGSTGETSYFGAVRNPVDNKRVAGGSSSGAAAAVASGSAVIALGSDTGGSVRQPAAYCGVVGYKPTYGTVSRYGLIAYASSLDQIGPIGKNTEDCAELLRIIRGIDDRDSTTLECGELKLGCQLRDIRIALPRECFSDGVSVSVSSSVLRFVKLLEQNGATVDYIDFPSIKYLIPTYYIIASAEASSNLSRYDGVKYGFRCDNAESLTEMYKKSRSIGFGKEVKKRIMLGTFVLSSGYFDAYYRKALKTKAVISKEFDKVFDKYDVIICPTAPNTAPCLGDSLKDPMSMYLSDVFTVGANIAGLPAVSLPCGRDSEYLPIGLQMIGQRLSDGKVLSLARELEKLGEVAK